MGYGFSTISFPVKDFNDESDFVVDTGKAVVSGALWDPYRDESGEGTAPLRVFWLVGKFNLMC